MFTRKRTAVFFFLGGIGCFILAALVIWHFTGKFVSSGPTPVAGPMPEQMEVLSSNSEARDNKGKNQPSKWVIYITGSIKVPGVYEIESGSRVYQAVDKAGGLTSEADPVAINMASALADGMHVHVPSLKERSNSPDPGMSSTPIGKISHSYSSNEQGKTDINRADLSELQSLPGIGPKTAENILSYRKERGCFSSVEELLKVKGIGPKKLEAIKDCVTCHPR